MLTFNNKIVLSNDKWIEKPLPLFPSVRIGNRLWSTEYASEANCGVAPTYIYNGIGYYTVEQAMSISLTQGWRVPDQYDLTDLKNTVGMSNGYDLIAVSDGGNDTYGLGLKWTGAYRIDLGLIPEGTKVYSHFGIHEGYDNPDVPEILSVYDSGSTGYITLSYQGDNPIAVPIRMVKEVYAKV